MITLAWSSIVGSQVLISIKRDKKFAIAVTVGAVVNLIFNILLIQKFKGVGTTISSLLAEFTGMFIMVYFTRDIINVKKLFECVPKYLISSVFMFIPIFIMGELMKKTILTTILQVFVGGIIYLTIMFICQDYNYMYISNFIRNFLRRYKAKTFKKVFK